MQARDIVEKALELLLAKDMAGFAGLWASDGVLEFPFTPAGYPARLTGREAVRDYLRDYPDHVDIRAVTEKTLHETTDPDVVVAEFAVDGVAVRTRRPYQLRYVAVVTVRDGEIRLYRDYWNPVAAAEALGGTGFASNG
ncbi:nuclear transport factor 2 family protein [Fodinicola acaciae]|uniref:nuclear transport factor 2 family protein n=1 Tax=Fodinicola acaciae TaxID=2681555 RepID=UPI0013D197F4|nr:nuclear transport factor 2 family protein [Fodinicola acaciae]